MDSKVNEAVQKDDTVLISPPHLAPYSSGLLSRFPFMRPSAGNIPRRGIDEDDDTFTAAAESPPPVAIAQLHNTRRRRGSLRKAALLGRGAQRERKDSKSLKIDISHSTTFSLDSTTPSATNTPERDALGLKVSDLAPRMSSIGRETAMNSILPNQSSTDILTNETQAERGSAQRDSYNSTTDEDDVLQMPHGSRAASPCASVSSGSESYFANRTVTARRRSFQQAKSPLSYSGITTTALPPPDSDWDYSETEWWGWVVLSVTWFVFVIGMGSCLNVWIWAWDVGKTPYAPPELEDDPTLPIVGYYPALIILTGVMAWVWVVVAWVGMKYFRHAKISGD
ncbi:hypothetical protein QQS21_005579 [Conoideocrella luteorostrata]|uniref:Uncharacterized protein n=1 Tax=Conoideocrella luteorostrata TaxID=1105319 RepID=A0AAJ0CQ98_9HYPO|nr:hypothetical protein QQS21_005579 [Conoideocrella luteorostrata]